MKTLARLGFVLILVLFIAGCDGQADEDGLPTEATPEPADRSDPWDEPGDWEDDDDDDDDATPPDGGPAFDPFAKGPYEIGNTTRLFIDSTRVDFYGQRQLLTEIWYPAAPETAEMEPDTIDKFMGKWADLVITIIGLVVTPEEKENLTKPTRSVREAPVAEGDPWPVVIFSHGNGGLRFQNMHLCEHLASHGFVVLAPDHTGNAAVTPLPSQLIIFNPLAMPFDFFWRQDDVAFLADTANWLNEHDNFGTFIGKLDAEHIAVGGHSFGAVTALEVARYDRRFDAVVSLSGFAFPMGFEGYTAPVLCMWGWEDRTLIELNIVQAKQAYEKIPTTKMWVGIRDCGHYSFTDSCDLVPSLIGHGDGCGEGHRHLDDSTFEFIDPETMYDLTNYYVLSFLSWALRGDDMWPTLTDNVWPEQITMYWSEGQ